VKKPWPKQPVPWPRPNEDFEASNVASGRISYLSDLMYLAEQCPGRGQNWAGYTGIMQRIILNLDFIIDSSEFLLFNPVDHSS